jgi:hypothetical protein
MFNLQGKDSDNILRKTMLIEETNYLLEWSKSQEVVAACKNRKFSISRILSWIFIWENYNYGLMSGVHLSESKFWSNRVANVGQALWDFLYVSDSRSESILIHIGELLINEKMSSVRFCCMKSIPNDFLRALFWTYRKTYWQQSFIQRKLFN